jgi:hypothetical protein
MTEQIPPPEDESRKSLKALIVLVAAFQLLALWSFLALKAASTLGV